MKRLSLCVLWALALNAQSISITSPAANAALTGWTGNTFSVSLTSAPSVVKVCYTVDAYPAYNPGIDAPSTLGCSISTPFSYPYNSYWNLNGPHQVVATAYDALGNVVATSAAVPFTTANNWPISFAPSMTVATGTALNANWSGFATVTPTLSGSRIGTDSLVFNFSIDGLLQQQTTNSTATATGTLNTAQFQNGPHNVCVQVYDNTTGTSYPGSIGWSGYNGAATEWCRTVTFDNGTTPSQPFLNAHEVYLAPGGTFQLSAQILNTDGTTTATTPVYQAVTSGIGNYMPGPPPYNAGGAANLQAGVATVSSSGLITAVANGAALISVMTPTITITDLGVGGIGINQVTSSAHSFTEDENGWLLNITGGPCNRGIYQIGLPQGSDAFVGNSSAVGPLGTSGCTATLGPTRQVWVYVWPTNTAPCYGQDGSIQASYTPNCMFVSSMFGATGSSVDNILTDQPYNSLATNICPSGWAYTGEPCGASIDFNASGFNTLEFGIYPSDITGSETASGFQSAANSWISAAEVSLGLFPKFRGLTIGASFFNYTQGLWALTYGNESSSSFIGSQTGMQWLISQYMARGNILGDTTADEITSIWGGAPLQGPITFSNSGTQQSALESITALNNGTCAAAESTSYPAVSFVINRMIIHGSVTSGMNSVAPATYGVSYPSGAGATAAISGGGSTVTVTITSGGTNYYIAPAVTLTGGGGTYSSATASVNSSGQVTGVTVTGASGYIAAPSVSFYSPNFVFACPGVANGVYNASNDPGLTVEPYGNGWYASNTSFMYYDGWARLRTQLAGISNRKFWFSNPTLGAASPSGFANWNGNPNFFSSQAIGSINSVADAGDLYWPFGGSGFIAARLSANGLLGGNNQGYWFRSLYGAYNPSIPFTEETEATSGYTGNQGYPVSVVSCVGDTITFSGPHLITNIIPGLTKLWITDATDSGGAVDSCNNNFMVLAAPTSTTLTVMLGATNFSCGTGCTSVTGNVTVAAGGATVNWNSGTQFSSWMVGHILFLNGVGGGPYIIQSVASATQLTISPAVGSGGFSANYTVNNGGVANWEDGTTTTLNLVNAAGVPSGFAPGNVTPSGQPISGFLDGDTILAATWSANNNRKRGQKFTLTGTAPLSTPTSACLVPADCTFAAATFVLLPENTNWTTLPSSGAVGYLGYREIPVLNATGGTANILPDLSYHKGFSGAQALADLNPGWAFGSVMECLLERCAGQRAYKIQRNQNGYWDQIGFTNAQGQLTVFSAAYASNQPYMNEHFEDGSAVPRFHAMSNASLMAQRLAKYLLQPSLNSPDCGFLVECAARAGSYGDVFFAFNASDGAQTKTFSLTPYEATGQNIIRYVVNDHSISGATIISSGTATDTITLQPEDAAFYVFPLNFAAELQQPAIAAGLADVPSATKVVVRFAYDRYYLDSAISNVYDCGTGACTPSWDRNIGPVYYRLIYLGPNSAVLATSDVQTF